ncbi:MAG: 30S ribosomal protein S20 [Patescibacteria group bacterium]|nr:30S ribosomal protein S20 [Patescibacteria group bacterium]
MAITKGAKKAHRASLRKRVFNMRRSRAMRETVKDARAEAGKSRDAQNEALKAAYAAIDKAAKRGVIKKNAAARKKSRLAKFLKSHSGK